MQTDEMKQLLTGELFLAFISRTRNQLEAAWVCVAHCFETHTNNNFVIPEEELFANTVQQNTESVESCIWKERTFCTSVLLIVPAVGLNGC